MSPAQFLADDAQTLLFAQRAAAALPTDGEPLVIYLQGDLGTGKTSIARGMLHAMGHSGSVRSPTYGLVAEYSTPAGLVIHLDLYRLRDESELAPLGLADYLPGSRLWLIEWPEQALQGLPAPDVRLQLAVREAGRVVSLQSASPRGADWVAIMRTETAL
jgi:tRNA threonylcarbamoyladenosine biosynthesis protein TsaE